MEQLGITVFDVAVIAIAVFGAAIGLSTGFAHAVLFIASWIAAGWVAWRFSKVVEPEVLKIVGSAELSYFISLLVVFVAALIVLIMLTSVLSRSIRSGPLGKPDKILGAGFGVLCAWAAMGSRLPVLRLPGTAPAAAGGRRRGQFPHDPRDGDLRGALPSHRIPQPPAAAGHGKRHHRTGNARAFDRTDRRGAGCSDHRARDTRGNQTAAVSYP